GAGSGGGLGVVANGGAGRGASRGVGSGCLLLHGLTAVGRGLALGGVGSLHGDGSGRQGQRTREEQGLGNGFSTHRHSSLKHSVRDQLVTDSARVLHGSPSPRAQVFHSVPISRYGNKEMGLALVGTT